MLESRVHELASRQYGSFSRLQVLHLGANDQLIRRRLAAGRWLQVAPGVHSLPGWPGSWRRSLWIAHLDVGLDSVVSHEAAAALHGLATFAPGPVVLTVSHGDHQRNGPFRLHQLTDVRSEHITDVDGLPTTTVARTLVDLAARVSRSRLERSVDDAHVSHLCSVDDVREVYVALRRPGKRGMKELNHVLAARGPGRVPTASELERRLLRALRTGGLPEPVAQYPLPWRVNAKGRVDFAYPGRRIIVEADGRRWHARMDQMENDRRRDREALNHGWRPYRFMWDEIVRHPETVCTTMRDALADGVPST